MTDPLPIVDPDNDGDNDGALDPRDVPDPGVPDAPEERFEEPDPKQGTGGLTAEKAEALIPKAVG